MRQTNLTDLSAFVAVAEHKSFRCAADQLGLTASALSHRLRQLEQRLGIRLLHRTTRSVSPTDAGRILLEKLRPAMDLIDDAVNAARINQDKPIGRLSLFVHPMLAQIVLTPVWRQFFKTYPDIQLLIGSGIDAQDIVAGGYDAGIAPREFISLDMTAVRVTQPLKLAFVGSPDYFAHNPPPKFPTDLKIHNCIQVRNPQTGKPMDWLLSRRPTAQFKDATKTSPVSGNLIVEDIDLAMRAAVDGLGITMTLETLADFFLRSGHLVRVLEDWSPSFDGFYLYYPGRRQIPPALRALIDSIKVSYHENKHQRPPGTS
jgi:DNA-binding transcriptional LysR family regulator